MKYKVGDVVKLRDDLEIYKYDVWLRIKGKPLTITETNCGEVYHQGKFISDGITIKSEEGLHYFVDGEMIEGLWEETKPKLKLIDILNKIANGELKEGTKVVWKGKEYILLDGIFARYIEFPNARSFLIEDMGELYRRDTEWLNDEVELIEPDHSPDIGKMAEPTDNTKIEELEYDVDCEEVRKVMDKLNEVIRHINKGAEE